MSDGSLSQDEIDALLQGTDTIEMDSAPAAASAAGLSEQERNALQSILRDVVESQSSNLGMLTGKTVRIDAPTVQVVAPNQLANDLPEQLIEVKIDFTEGLSGGHSYLLTIEGATRIASLMMGQDSLELDEVAYSTVGEAISNIAGPATTAIGHRIDSAILTAAPVTRKAGNQGLTLPGDGMVVKVEYPLTIEGDMPTRLIELYSLQLVKEIVGQTGASAPAASAMGQAPSRAAPFGPSPPAMTGYGDPQQPFGGGFGGMGFGGQSPPSVQPVQFATLQGGGIGGGGEQGNIGLLMDVFMEMTVELGRTRKLVKDILTIGEGSIIELDKLAGEPVDILVNHKLIAKGEVVVIDENFGVRVTEIVSPMERMSETIS